MWEGKGYPFHSLPMWLLGSTWLATVLKEDAAYDGTLLFLLIDTIPKWSFLV